MSPWRGDRIGCTTKEYTYMVTDDGTRSPLPDMVGDKPRLQGRMGVFEIAFTVMAFSSPLTVAWGYLPVVILFGGIGAPINFLFTMGLLLLFSVGYVKMSRSIPNPGAFYAFIAHGISKTWGLGSAYLASFGYLAILAGINTFFGISLGAIIESLGGPSIPWYILSPILLMLVGVFGYVGIQFSAKTLAALLVLEVLAVVIFDVVAFINGGADGRSLEPLTIGAFIDGGMGLGILFCITMFIGFEGTAIFREEAKDPDKTIPRATYLSVGFIGIFYSFTTWMLINTVGSDSVMDKAENDPAGLFPDAFASLLGVLFKDIVGVFLLTSIFASTLATHNIMSRYLYNLGVDKALPQYLGEVHPKQHSPYKASITTSAATAVVLALAAIIGFDPGMFYGRAAGVGAMSLMVLMLFTSIAVIVHFRRPGNEASAWSGLIAPGLATLGLGVVIILSIAKFNLLLGTPTGLSVLFLLVILAVFVAGIIVANYLKKSRPDIYERIGRAKV
jgi:amino acid transporter